MAPPPHLLRPTHPSDAASPRPRRGRGGADTLDDLSVIDVLADQRTELVRQLELLAAPAASDTDPTSGT
jgi:hypothetical protein